MSEPAAEARALLVLVTAPAAEAPGLARALVTGGLAACASLCPGLVSVYRWQGQVEEAAETLLLIKTTSARYAALEAEVRRLHSYEVPEILAVPIAAGSRSYLDWLCAAVEAP